jgi:MYXO-CTERM domain-containing protein
MTANRAIRFFAALSMFVALLMAQRAQADNFDITVNTSGLQGTSGYIDFQFNPGNTPFDAASATITGFATDGALTTALPDIGDVSGALPGQVLINNSQVLNEYTQGLTYGSFIDVFVNLTIPTISGTAVGGSSFTFDVEDSNFNSLLGSFPAVEIDLDATTGQPSITNNSGGAVTVTTVTPEPDSLWLAGLGLAGLIAARRRRTAGEGAVRPAD